MSRDPAFAERLIELLEKGFAGDSTCYESFLNEVAELLRPFVMKKLRRSDSVEDVVQEILISVHGSVHTFDLLRPLLPWLYAIADYRCTDCIRRQIRKESRETGAELDFENLATIEGSRELEIKQLVSGTLAELPEHQRQVLELLKLQGYSVSETAAALGMTESNVKVTAHRAIKAMRAGLGEENT